MANLHASSGPDAFPSVQKVISAAWKQFVRWRYLIALSSYLLGACVGDRSEGDLYYLSQGMHLLISGGSQGNVHLYATNPNIQIGPIGFLFAGLLELLDGGHFVLASVLAAGVLLAVQMHYLEQLAPAHLRARARAAVALAAVPLALAWADVVPGAGHLEDLLALIFLTVAVGAARREQATLTGAMLALAVDAKPWAAFAVTIVVLLPWRSAWRAALVCALGVGVCWLPFVLGDPHTLGALRGYGLTPGDGSLLSAIGHPGPASWVRTAQAASALLLIAGFARWRRWELLLLTLAVTRMALDAGTFHYYDAELVVGAALADVASAMTARRLWEWLPLSLPAWLGIDYGSGVYLNQPGRLYAVRAAVLGSCLVYAVGRSCVQARHRRLHAEGQTARTSEVQVAPSLGTPSPVPF